MPRKRKSDVEEGASTGPTKRAKNDPDAEKRLAKWKPKCPQNILERVSRVMTQRFFMISRDRVDGELREEFTVSGSTGNVYKVVIDNLPTCTCPDAQKGNHCKHILFIFLKVLAVPQTSELYYQKALLSNELETIFANAPEAPNSLTNPYVKAAYLKAIGKGEDAEEEEAKAEESDKNRKRIPQEGDDCPICYESMHDVEVKKLTFCEECGNALHNECFQQWAKTKNPITCVWCRAEWRRVAAAASGSKAAGVITSEGYLNIGAVAGVSPVRDTSSYYRGPRRGDRWSYGGYSNRYY